MANAHTKNALPNDNKMLVNMPINHLRCVANNHKISQISKIDTLQALAWVISDLSNKMPVKWRMAKTSPKPNSIIPIVALPSISVSAFA